MPDEAKPSAAVPHPSPEARWPAFLGVLAIAGLQFALPQHLRTGPSWLLLVVVILMEIPVVVARRTGRLEASQNFAYAVLAVITTALIVSLGRLIFGGVVGKDAGPKDLLLAATGLWFSNILTFAVWYWRLDAGGPHARDKRHFHDQGSFFFPPMAMNDELRKVLDLDRWRPGFVDYLFLSFCTSTAFSPTDTPVLTRWAKVLTMIQGLISLSTVGILAARAVNVL